jgi:hypothetical protein
MAKTRERAARAWRVLAPGDAEHPPGGDPGGGAGAGVGADPDPGSEPDPGSDPGSDRTVMTLLLFLHLPTSRTVRVAMNCN